jgi:hypothetical protein
LTGPAQVHHAAFFFFASLLKAEVSDAAAFRRRARFSQKQLRRARHLMLESSR